MAYHHAFWQAIESGNTSAIKTFLDNGLDPNIIGPEENMTQSYAIVRAAKLGHVDIVRLLAHHPSIQKTTVVDAYDAALNTNHAALIQLFETKEFIRFQNLFGESMLHRAVYNQKKDNVLTLLNLNIDPNHKDEKGNRPLGIACRFSSIDIVEALLMYGADPDPAQDDLLSRPLTICAQTSNLPIMELILKHMDNQRLVDQYLARLKLERRAPSIEYLKTLQRTHIETIPHENINGTYNIPAAFTIEHLLNKYTQENRGGMCFELNYSFGWLLHQLGFKVELKLAWVIAYNDAKEHSPYPTHPVVIVSIDGQQYLADVGWSDSYRHPLSLNGSVYHDVGGTGAYLVRPKDEHRYVMQKHLLSKETGTEEWMDQFTFAKPKAPLNRYGFPEGFFPAYVFTCVGPDYLFTHLFKFTKLSAQGHTTIWGNKIFSREGHEKRTGPLPCGIPQLLEEQFNIPPRVAKQCVKITRSTSVDSLSFFRKKILDENPSHTELRKSL